MAFTSVILGQGVVGNQRKTWGTFANDGGSTGGDINTGLRSVHEIFLQAGGAAAHADAPAVNETLPCAGSAVTIVTTADKSGYWTAFGD